MFRTNDLLGEKPRKLITTPIMLTKYIVIDIKQTTSCTTDFINHTEFNTYPLNLQETLDRPINIKL